MSNAPAGARTAPLTGTEWRVRIDRAGRVAGAGFLVTPDTVLTCAHVVRGQGPLTVTFTEIHGRPGIPAKVIKHGGWADKPTDPGDVAVLRLAEPVPHPPAALAPATAAYGTPPRKLIAFGYPNGYKEGVFAEYRVTTHQLISREWLQLEAWQSDGQPLARGFSGAAVTLADTGEVVGMVTAAGPSGIRNGRMMPTQVIAQYWPDLQSLMPADSHATADRVRLRALVEQASRADLDCDPVRLYTDVAGPFDPPPPEEGFDSLRSAALFVLCELDGPNATQTVARFTDQLQRLLHTPSTPKPDGPPQWAPILVELGHSGAGDGMVRLEVSAYSGGRRHPVASRTVPRSRLLSEVQDGIEAAFRYLTPGADELITFSLPRDWLDLPVDQWQKAPDDPTPLGCVHPVVVTDHSRRRTSVRHVLTRVWKQLDSRPDNAPTARVDCTGGVDPRRLRKRLHRGEAALAAFATAPATPRTREHFTVSLTAPAPAVVWSRRGCGGGNGCKGGDGCSGKAFLDELEAAVAGVPPAELPRRILDLREEAHAEDGHWAGDIQLVWDAPRFFPDPHIGAPAGSPVG